MLLVDGEFPGFLLPPIASGNWIMKSPTINARLGPHKSVGGKATDQKPEASRKSAKPVFRAQKHLGPSLHESTAPLGFAIVGVGASAGGLEAFTQLLEHLPLDTDLGFVLVQHLDPQHESALSQLLARATSMPVREVTNNLRVEPNHVYVIPPNKNLSVYRGFLKLQRRQETRTSACSIDSFFESLAEDQGQRAIGVILSGTATDGTLGLEAIKAEGGINSQLRGSNMGG